MEILFRHSGAPLPDTNNSNYDIRRLSENDCAVFARHLELCGQRPLSEDDWREVCASGTIYFGLFENGKMVARACREIISEKQWEVADVRVVPDCRNRGLAFEICRFVLEYITSAGKTPSIRTKPTNAPMLRVIKKLGFVSE